MDYRTEAHTINANASYFILPNWSITTDLAFTIGRGNITDLDFDSMYPTGDAKLDLNVSAVNPNMPHLYDVAYLNSIDKYSDLEYKQLDFNIGTSYRMDNGIGLTLNYSLFYYDDNAPYVYGDQGSTTQLLMGYLSYSF